MCYVIFAEILCVHFFSFSDCIALFRVSADLHKSSCSKPLNCSLIKDVTPFAPITTGKDKKTSFSIPSRSLANVETVATSFLLSKIIETSDATVKPMAQLVYPLPAITS
uniref:Uncharacterized protein n=1 Tax=Ceratitis capitata TaxID=7213 RepID=W8B8X0_CERCA